MFECTAEGKQPCSPRAPARTVLSPETLAAARDSASQDHFLVLDRIAAVEDTAQSRMSDHIDDLEAQRARRECWRRGTQPELYKASAASTTRVM